MGETSIGWTDRSINPIRARHRNTGAKGHHCEKVSPGCQNCYASAMQTRFGLPEFSGPSRREKVELWFDGSKLAEVLRRKAPTKWFWADMTDLFGDWVNNEWLNRCFAAMCLTPRHTHQVLTKRPQRMLEYMSRPDTPREVSHWMAGNAMIPAEYRDGFRPVWPPPNVWCGVSVENQQTADERIPLLLQTPAAVRFLSVEPLLGPVSLQSIQFDRMTQMDVLEGVGVSQRSPCQSIPNARCRRIDWVIVGGESGKNRRPCEVTWIEDLARQCREAGTACFIKQDCAIRPGQQGRIPPNLWTLKQFPVLGPDGRPPPY